MASETIEKAVPASGLAPDQAIPCPEESLIGLIGWLAALETHVRPLERADAATAMVPNPAVANVFQIGYLPETGPFLAYPGELWWFGGAWRAAAAGPAGIALIANDSVELALVLPGDWPKFLTEFAGLCVEHGSLALYPYAGSYTVAWSSPSASPQPVAGVADLNTARGVVLSFPVEVFPWLDPVLRSPLRV